MITLLVYLGAVAVLLVALYLDERDERREQIARRLR